MATRLNSSKGLLRIISKLDDAVPTDLTNEEWEAYTKTLDESILRLVGEPTYYVMRRSLPFEAQQEVANQQVGMSGGKAILQFGYTLEEMRCALVDIENPKSVPLDQQITYRKDSDGFTHRELIADLNTAGYIADLFATRAQYISPTHQKK